MKFRVIITCFVIISVQSFAQESNNHRKSVIQPFIAYEFGEAAFNSFQSISGEIGISLSNKHLFRFVHQNVRLTEEHLSSNFARAVEGENVKGRMIGFEIFYSYPVLKRKEDKNILYLSPSFGYYKNQYTHTILEENFEHNSMTVGMEISYRELNLFGIKGLYYTVSIPMRTPLRPHEEVMLGETRILNSRFDNNIWLLIGYQF